MKPKQKMSKAQTNMAVRRVLAQYQIDLTKLNYSSNSKSIYISGFLIKCSGSEVQMQEMLSMVQELAKYGAIRSDIDNWVLSAEAVHYTGKDDKKDKKKKKDKQTSQASGDAA